MNRILYTTGLALILMAPRAVLADTPRHTVDFTHPLLDPSGKPMVQNGMTVTIGSIVARCLDTDTAGPAGRPEPASPTLYALATRIVNAKAAVLSAPEIAAIEACVGKMAPLVSGQVDPLIDPNFKFAPLQ